MIPGPPLEAVGLLKTNRNSGTTRLSSVVRHGCRINYIKEGEYINTPYPLRGGVSGCDHYDMATGRKDNLQAVNLRLLLDTLYYAKVDQELTKKTQSTKRGQAISA